LLGFNQEYRAEKAMAALKKISVPSVKVRRDGHVREIPARELVPGDIVLLEAGNLVPADCRVLEGVNLRIQESALTGESEPVEKDPQALPDADSPLGDRRDMAYMGTTVTYGRGQGAVTETGLKTELDRIAAMIQTVEREPTPLQKRLDQLGKNLALAALVIVSAIFILGLLRGEEVKLMLLTAMSLTARMRSLPPCAGGSLVCSDIFLHLSIAVISGDRPSYGNVCRRILCRLDAALRGLQLFPDGICGMLARLSPGWRV